MFHLIHYVSVYFSLDEKLKINSLEISNYRCFNHVQIDFKSSSHDSTPNQWTVLMGSNNTGKASILKAIAELLPVPFNDPRETRLENHFVPSILYDKAFPLDKKDTVTRVDAFLSNNQNWWYSNTSIPISETPSDKTFLLFGYGVSRYPSSTSLTENKTKPCATLFSSDSRLINLEEWLMQLDYASKNDKTLAENRLNKIKELICGNLFPEIYDFNFESSDELHNYVLFKTKDGEFRYTDLGYGYQSMLSWIVDLCKRMFDAYPNEENPLHGEAVVLVDEIDLHLHPKWQREIITYLSQAFPNVQFIVTTHSPLVVQSMENINLYLLKRDKEGKILVERSALNNYSGWTVEEILRDAMGLDSDINSTYYNELVKKFNEGLDSEDKKKVEEAYKVLDKILHPNNPIRRMFQLQKDTM